MIEWILLGAGALFLLGRKKQTVAGIGKVETHNPNIVFLQKGIKINGELIEGIWYRRDSYIGFVCDHYNSRQDMLLEKFFKIQNDSNPENDFFETTSIYFSQDENRNYLSEANAIVSEREQKKIDVFQRWLSTLDIKIVQKEGSSYAFIYRNGTLLGIIGQNRSVYQMYRDKSKMYKLLYYVHSIGFENAFAAYL